MGRKTIKKSNQLVSMLLIILAFAFLTQEQIMTYISELKTRQLDMPGDAKLRYVPLKSNRLIVVYGSEKMILNSTITTHRGNAITTEGTITSDFRKYETNGERNAARTNEVCQKYQNFQRNEFTVTVRLNRNETLLFCPIYEIGTTFWRRVLMIERERTYSNLVSPFDLPFDREYPSTKLLRKVNETNPFYKVMFTRNPYNRLFSFFVDKMLASNPYFWKTVGVSVVKLTREVRIETLRKVCGHDISFSEFIKYVIYTLETRHNIDPHWAEMNKICFPCEIKYDFIGKMEEFQEDSTQILTKLGLNKMASFLETNGKEAAIDDAIKDTLNQPFSFREKYKTCMSFKEAILRAWQKLQIRGLIGNDTLDVLLLNEKTTKVSDVIKRASISRQMSTPIIRKKIKDDMYRKYWSDVPSSDVLKLQKLYATDFELFDYEKSPDILFHSRKITV